LIFLAWGGNERWRDLRDFQENTVISRVLEKGKINYFNVRANEQKLHRERRKYDLV